MHELSHHVLEFVQHLFRAETTTLNRDFVIGNVLSGVVGTIVGFLGNQLIVFIKNKNDERKYTIAGEYMTIFGDEKDGAKLLRKAPITLRQSGKTVRGVTTEKDGNEKRTWELEGEIRPNDRITGWYKEKGFEAGSGTFFLEVKRNKDMEGLWAGYDSVNRKVTSGIYLFRLIPRVTIRNITSPADTAVILDMADKQLGRDYIRPEDIGSAMPVAICAELVGKVIGFCTGKILKPEEFLTEVKGIQEASFPGLMALGKIGMLKSIAVDPIYVGRCVGSQLVQECIARLSNRGAKMLFMIAWRSSHGTNIGPIGKRLGFKEKHEIPNYWENESLTKGYSCPECGKPPCRCTAILYARPN